MIARVGPSANRYVDFVRNLRNLFFGGGRCHAVALGKAFWDNLFHGIHFGLPRFNPANSVLFPARHMSRRPTNYPKDSLKHTRINGSLFECVGSDGRCWAPRLVASRFEAGASVQPPNTDGLCRNCVPSAGLLPTGGERRDSPPAPSLVSPSPSTLSSLSGLTEFVSSALIGWSNVVCRADSRKRVAQVDECSTSEESWTGPARTARRPNSSIRRL